MLFWQAGQNEPGNAMDNFSGIRKIQTFKKLPIIDPRMKDNMKRGISALGTGLARVSFGSLLRKSG